MYRIAKCFLALCIVCCLSLTAQVQSPVSKDSLRFQPVLDSVKMLLNAGRLDDGIAKGEKLLQQVLIAESDWYIVETNKVLGLAKIRSDEYEQEEVRRHRMDCYNLSKSNQMYRSMLLCADGVAITFFNKSQYDSAKKYYQIVMETARDHVPTRYPLALANMAFIHGVLDQRDEEVKYYIEALKVSEENPDYERVVAVSAMAYSGIGDYYLSIGELDKALEGYQGKLKLALEHDMRGSQYEAHFGLGKVYQFDEYYDFKKSEENYLVVTKDTSERFAFYKHRAAMGLAELYSKEKRFEESRALLLNARDYYQRMGSNDYVSFAEELLAVNYFNTEELKESRKWAEKAIASTRENGLISRERRALRTLYKIDSMEGKYRNAFFNFQRYTQIDDSLNAQEITNRLNELQVQYETEQTTRQNESLKASLDLEALKSQRKTTIITAVGAISILLIVSMIFTYRNYSRKKRDHDTIASQAAELKKLSDFKEGLTGMVVHDMKNPINSIIGFSRGTPDERKMKKINQSGYNILNLVTNMLDIQRFEEAKVEVISDATEAHRLVADAGNEVHLLLQAKSLRFKNQVAKGVILNVEKTLLDRVLVNLLTNAIKYSESGAEVVVSLGKAQNNYQEIIVQDFGEGISPEKLPFIFNKFWHKDARKSGLAPSTGLGLSFCKLAVEAHGGTIRVESKVGEGTSMIFTVPLSSESVSSHANLAHPKEDTGEHRLKSEDTAVLQTYMPELKKLKVYQVSAINKIIHELESQGLDPDWTLALQAAVYQGDQVKYEELISQNEIDELA